MVDSTSAPPTSPIDLSSTVTVEDAIPWSSLRTAWVSQLGVDPGPSNTDVIKLCRCDRSQLHFFWPLSLAAPPSFYATLERFPWYYRRSKWEYARAMDIIPSTGTLLDVGCGAGHFLTLAQQKGLAAVGLELNESAVARARSVGLNVRLETIEDAASRESGGFDVITAFQVLEHVAKPRDFLTFACRLLRPGGVLIIAVPNSGGWLRFAGGVLECPPHHVTRWNGAALQYIAQIFPVHLDTIETEPLTKEQVPDFVRSVIDPVTRLTDLSRKRRFKSRLVGRSLSHLLQRMDRFHNLPGTSQMAVFIRQR